MCIVTLETADLLRVVFVLLFFLKKTLNSFQLLPLEKNSKKNNFKNSLLWLVLKLTLSPLLLVSATN